ncbi:MAG TPA: iron dependent repressor, metal binding and dimerization domain protein [Terriglobia bacterium]|nr:iron dependent repressor, metal binding and dimerization domain protein [Terriglobia bacterium]
MAQEELLKLDDDTLSLTRQGERRAREVIRRHRLSERLFFEMFNIHEDLLDDNACKIEHSLSSEVTEKLCIFLKHPQTCPHGSPIPRGACCPKS